MSARVQGLILGLGKAKQADIATASASFLRFKKIDTGITSPLPSTENDAAEVGKGNEFISAGGVFPVSYDVANRLEKFGSAEFTAWAWSYALGNVVQSGSSPNWVDTVTPIDPGTSLELPYFSLVEQIAEGGGNAIDNLYIGCAIEEVSQTITFGPGRASNRLTVNWVGSGKLTTPSGVLIPALTVEKNMLGASMALNINGVNYVSNKNILTVTQGWKNNLMLNAGFFPGSGLQNGYAIRGRMEIGARVPTLTFSTRLTKDSDEYTKLVAQTTGTAVVSVNYDTNNSAQWTWQQISYQVVENAEADGIVTVNVTVAPQWHATNGILTFVGKCGITGIAQ
jgi:hypothetical protein